MTNTEYQHNWYLEKVKKTNNKCSVCNKSVGLKGRKCLSCTAKSRPMLCKPIKTAIKIPCFYCHKIILRTPFRLKKNKNQYCNRFCYQQYQKEFMLPEQHNGWKGTNVSYSGLHHWVKKQLGKAFWCTWCFSMINVQWANLSGEYKRDLNDWLQLCVKCHMKYDKKNNWGKAIKLFLKKDKIHFSERILQI